MRGLFFKGRTLPDFDGRELRGLSFGHAQIEPGSRGSFVYGYNSFERRTSFYKGYGALTEGWFGAHHGLYRKIGNVNGSKSHKKPIIANEIPAF
jgi:hypothetical protein